VTGIAVASGPLVGGAVAEGFAWEWIFWLNVPIGLAAIPFVFTRIEESFGGDRGLDVPGLALISAAFLGIVWGLVRGNAAGWGSVEVVGTLAGGLVLLGAFIVHELRAREPMVPVRLFGSRAFAAGNGAMFFLTAALFGAIFFFAQMLQAALAYGPLDAGLRLVPFTATFITIAPVVGNLVDRVGERPFIVAGLSLQAVALGWIALIADAGLTYGQFVLPSILAGAGVSLAIPAAQNAAVGAVGEADVGKAAGANSMMRELGGVLGVAVAVAVFAGAGSLASPAAFFDGFAPAMAALAVFALAGAIVGLAVPSRRPARAVVGVAPVPALEADGGS
jgi:MFS family permease